MTDDQQQRGEELDESLPGDFPPDEPSAVDDIGTTGLEQLGGESFADRDRRTEPDFGERGAARTPSDEVVEAGVPPTDGDVDEVLLPVDETGDRNDTGPLSDEDEFTGDETTRDFAPERMTPPAEEAAIHVEEP